MAPPRKEARTRKRRALIGAVGVVLILIASVIDRPRYPNYHGQPYYQQTSRAWKNPGARGLLTEGPLKAGFAATPLRPQLGDSMDPNASCVGVRLDNLLLLSTPCDFSAELAADLTAVITDRTRLHAITTSFNGGYVGYVTPTPYYDRLDTYETRTMAFYGPWLGDYMVEVLTRIADGLSGRPTDHQSDFDQNLP